MIAVVRPGIKVETHGLEPVGVLRDIAATLVALDEAPSADRAEILDDMTYLLTVECRHPCAVVTVPGKGRRCVYVDRHGDIHLGNLGQRRETPDPAGGVRIGRTGRVHASRRAGAREE
jgi:hypothetical protein